MNTFGNEEPGVATQVSQAAEPFGPSEPTDARTWAVDLLRRAVSQLWALGTAEGRAAARDNARAAWLAIGRWFRVNSFVPDWLPLRWRHPALGYIVAVVTELLALSIAWFLAHVVPRFEFRGLVELLGILLVALSWGAGPSLAATATAALLVGYTALAHLGSNLTTAGDALQFGLFLVIGGLIGVFASRGERLRQMAQAAHDKALARADQMEATIEAMMDGVVFANAAGRVTQMNRAYCELVGLDTRPEQAAVLSDPAQTLQIRDDRGALLQAEQLPLARILRGEALAGASAMDLVLQTLDGRTIEASATGAPIHDTNGAVAGAVAIFHDVTERNQLARNARAQTYELEAMFEAMADGIVVYDAAGNVRRANQACRLVFGLADHDDFFSHTPEERARLIDLRDEQGNVLTGTDLLDRRLLRGEAFSGNRPLTVRIRRRDGRERVLSLTGAPLTNGQGRITGALAVYRDITAQRRLEQPTYEALRALLLMAETLVQVPDGAHGEPGEVVTTERAARRLTELARDVLGYEDVSLVTLDPQTAALIPLAVIGLLPEREARWLAQRSPDTLATYLAPDAVERLTAGQVVVHRLPDAPPPAWPPCGTHAALLAPLHVGTRLIGVLSLSARTKRENFGEVELELAQAVARLAGLLVERERLLREREEARTHALALQEANRRMDTFIGLASHELKTPLTSLKTNLQILERRMSAQRLAQSDPKSSLAQFLDEVRPLIQRPGRSIERLTRLINDLLDMSRIQEDRLEMHLKHVDLATIVREAAEEQRAAEPTRNIVLRLPRTTPASNTRRKASLWKCVC